MAARAATIRVLSFLLGLWLLTTLAEGRRVALAYEVNQTGEFSLATWLAWVGIGIVGGALLLLAALPARPSGGAYRWRLAGLLAIVPLGLLSVELSFWTLRWWPPRWIVDVVLQGSVAIPAGLGAALVAGYTLAGHGANRQADRPDQPDAA